MAENLALRQQLAVMKKITDLISRMAIEIIPVDMTEFKAP